MNRKGFKYLFLAFFSLISFIIIIVICGSESNSFKKEIIKEYQIELSPALVGRFANDIAISRASKINRLDNKGGFVFKLRSSPDSLDFHFNLLMGKQNSSKLSLLNDGITSPQQLKIFETNFIDEINYKAKLHWLY